MIYQVIFKDFTLDYKIIDSPVSQIWVELTKQSLANNLHASTNQWTNCWPTEEYILDLWNKIETLAVVKGLTLAERSQLALNQLHKEFHAKAEAAVNNGLEELNNSIHSLEHALRLIKGPARWNSQVGFYLEPSFTKPITDSSLYKYWNYNPSNNDLCLGYHTIGKNIYQCWRDNDSQLVREGMLRPQITISTEVNLIFTKGNPIFDPLDELSKQVDSWISHNSLDKYVNRKEPKNQFLGTPLLGKYIGTSNSTQINQLIQQGARVVSAKLIE